MRFEIQIRRRRDFENGLGAGGDVAAVGPRGGYTHRVAFERDGYGKGLKILGCLVLGLAERLFRDGCLDELVCAGRNGNRPGENVNDGPRLCAELESIGDDLRSRFLEGFAALEDCRARWRWWLRVAAAVEANDQYGK